MAEENGKKAWYAVHTYSGYENKVKNNLEKRIETMNMEDFIFRCMVPMEKVTEMKNGVPKTMERKVFPGYVLVEMIMTDESWYVVRNTTGVTGFVGTGNKAVPLQDHEIAALLRVAGEDEPMVTLTAVVGDKVRIVGTAFTDMVGTVESIDEEKRKVMVLVPMFGGRETPIELEYHQIQAV